MPNTFNVKSNTVNAYLFKVNNSNSKKAVKYA